MFPDDCLDLAPAPVHDAPKLNFRQPWTGLGSEFFRIVPPQGLPEPALRLVSEPAARLLGLEPPRLPEQRRAWAELFSGNRTTPDCAPICTVYAGHQFGAWAGQLGDGRAHLLGEVDAPDATQNCGHARWEIQIKGAGRTPYSRAGDGRAVLRSSLREYLCSEAMWHLGVPTTRALCLVDSALPVRREVMETAAVVTRLAPSFVRFGHFEHFSYSAQTDALRRLVAHANTLLGIDPEQPAAALALLRETAARTARLIARWQALGFVHGVMNTDNMSILGWTLDYGPFGFMDAFDPGYTPNTTDAWGRYAWARQPEIAGWNLAALAQALLPLIPNIDDAREAVDDFDAAFAQAWDAELQAKLGLGAPRAGDADLARRWLQVLAASGADWTLSFRLLGQVRCADTAGTPEVPAELAAQCAPRASDFASWLRDYRARVLADVRGDAQRRTGMQQVNPRFVLRHHLLQEVIAQAQAGDFDPASRLLDILRAPYDEQGPEQAFAAAPPPPDAAPARLSCSS